MLGAKKPNGKRHRFNGGNEWSERSDGALETIVRDADAGERM